MALSPFYNWSEPDNTDLVKNGAQAMRTLGDAIDTSVWNVGYGQAGKNKIINGNFSVNQRNFTSVTTTNTYTFDRWQTEGSGGTTTWSAQTFTAGAAPVSGYESKNFLRMVSSGQSSTVDYMLIDQRIEDVRTFAGQTVTLSFWAKAASGTPKVGTSFVQVFGSGGSGNVIDAGGDVTISTSWARYSITNAIPSISGKTVGTGSYLRNVLWTSSGAAYTSYTNIGIQNATIDIWGVQLEAGSKATPFQTASGGSIQGELAMCQRYFQLIASGTSKVVVNLAAYDTTSAYGVYFSKVSMRAAPTLAIVSGTNYFQVWGTNNGGDSCDVVAIDNSSPDQVRMFVNALITVTQGSAYWLSTNNASAFLALQSEL